MMLSNLLRVVVLAAALGTAAAGWTPDACAPPPAARPTSAAPTDCAVKDANYLQEIRKDGDATVQLNSKTVQLNSKTYFRSIQAGLGAGIKRSLTLTVWTEKLRLGKTLWTRTLKLSLQNYE